MSARQNSLLESVLPQIKPTADDFVDNPILEIGFGAGEHMINLACENPDKIVIGAEPFLNGVASLLSHISDDMGNILPEYKNIRIWPGDVRDLINPSPLPPSAREGGIPETNPVPISEKMKFSKIYILHPDPWPKSRHEKRRLCSAEFLTLIGSCLSTDGVIVIGTDHYDYFDWLLEQVKNNSQLTIHNAQLDADNFDFFNIPEIGLNTRYMVKNKFGSLKPKYLLLGGFRPAEQKLPE